MSKKTKTTPTTQDAPKARSQVKTLEELRRMKIKGPDKKSSVIKDISKVLNDIEESKRIKKVFYFSSLQGRGVYDAKKKYLGRIKDLAISGGSRLPEVSHLLIEKHTGNLLIPWKHVTRYRPWVELGLPFERTDYRAENEDDVFLARNILDKQVVDVNGLKVIRVNDIALTNMKDKLVVVSIDVGSRSLLRRLGLFGLAEQVPFFNDHPVPWGSVEPLTRSLEKIHLKVPCARVSDLHPADVADVFEELSMNERNILLRSMKSEKAAKVILECEPEVRSTVIKGMKMKRLAAVLEKMPSNDAANLISELDKARQQFLLHHMARDAAEKIQGMLSYNPGSVARFMSSDFVTVRKDCSVQETLDFIRQFPKKPESFHYVYVVDEAEALCGVISLKNLIVTDPGMKLSEAMTLQVVTVEISDPIEYVEDIISKYDLLSIPVVDISKKVRGVVNIDDVLDLIVERSKARQDFELSDGEKHKIREEKLVKDFYSTIFKDIGQLVRDLEPANIVRQTIHRRRRK